MHWSQKVTPARSPQAVVPADGVDLPTGVKGIYVGTGGDVNLRGVGSDTAVLYKNLPNASYIDVEAIEVLATGTTATDLVAEL